MDKGSTKNRLNDLKIRLHELGYKENFGSIESLDLIEHLLTDVKNLSSSYKQVSEKEVRLANDLALAQAQLFPLRKDCARLARENNDLHLDQIKLNDSNRATVDEYTRKIRAVENDHGQLKLVVEAKNRQIADFETHLKRIREAYSEVSDPKGKKNQKKDMDISRRLNSTGSPSSPSIDFSAKDHQFLTIDNSIVDTLRGQVDTLSSALKKAEDEIKRLNTSIASREQELSRSSKFISIVSSNYVDTADVNPSSTILPSNRSEQLLAADVANKRIIDQLNGQVDFLNEQLAAKEQQLIEIGDKIRRFETVQMELSQRTVLLDQTRKENAQLTSHCRQMEEKMLDLQLQNEQLLKTPPKVVTIESPESKDETENVLQINRLAEENADLVAEVKRLTGIVEAFDAKQKASTAASWKQGVKGAKVQTDSLISDLNKEVESHKKTIANLKKQLSDRNNDFKLVQNEKEELSKRLKLHEHTRNKSEAEKVISDLRESLTRKELIEGRLMQELEEIRKTSEDATLELVSLRKQYRDLLLQTEHLNLNSQLLQSDLSACKNALEEHVLELSKTREQHSKLNLQLTDATTEKDILNKKCGLLKSQLDDSQSAVDQLQHQLSIVSHSTAISRSESSTSSVIIEQLQADKKKLMEDLHTLETERNDWERQKSTLNHIVDYLGLQQSEHQSRVSDSIVERTTILTSLQERDSQIESLKLQLNTLQSEITRKSDGLQFSDQAMKSLKEEYLSIKLLAQQQSARISQLQSDALLSHQRLEHAEAERDQYLEQIDELQSNGDNAAMHLSSTHQDILLMQHQIAQLTAEKEDIQTAFEDFRRQSELQQRRNRSENQDYQTLLKQKNDLERKVQENKLLLSNYDATKKSMEQKHDMVYSRLKSSEDERFRLEQQIESLKASILERDSKINEKQGLLEELDEERDRLQYQLDLADDSLSQKNQAFKQLEIELLQSRQVSEQLQSRLSGKDKELHQTVRIRDGVESRLNALQIEYNTMKRLKEELQSDVNSYNKDLKNMIHDNQATHAELNDRTAERDRLQVRVSELMQACAGSDQQRRALEIERNDLVETYRNCLRERNKLEKEVISLSELKHKDSHQSQQMFNEMNELHGVIAGMKNNEKLWINDKLALSKQIELLNEQLMRLQARTNELEDEKRKILQDTHALRNINAQLNDRINLVIKRATAATEANKILTSTLGSVEKERDAVRQLVNIERQRASEMGQLVEAARTQTATKDLQLQSLRSKVQASEHSEVNFDNTVAGSSSSVESHHVTTVRRTVTTVTASSNVEGSENHTHTHSD